MFRYFANGSLQLRQIGAHNVPNPLRIDNVVAMPENVTDTRNIAPRDLRMFIFVALGDVPDRF